MSIGANKKDMSNPLTAAAAAQEETELSMFIGSIKKDTSNPLTAAAANTDDSCDNMSYGSTNDANNGPVASTGSSTTLEKLQEDISVISLQDTKEDGMSVEIVREDMSVTSVLDTKEDDTSAFCTTSEKLREDDMSVTTTKQHETLLQ
jgi:hypothetical protein